MEKGWFSKLLFKKILIAGLVVGILDIIAAFIDAWLSYNVSPGKVLNGIAAGAIGNENANSSFRMIIFGLLIHFFIVYSYTFLFCFIYPALKASLKNNIVIGVLYGLFIWASMRFIVLPVLSQVEFAPFKIVKAFKPILILIGTIGIPLSLMMSRIAKLHQTNRNNFIEIENPMI
jgi:magnesium-transporting ATPase (P-type)